MIQLAPQMRIQVAIEPADFRRGIDGLARLVREELRGDPFCGGIFVFPSLGGATRFSEPTSNEPSAWRRRRPARGF